MFGMRELIFNGVVDKGQKRLDNRSSVRFRMSDDGVPKLIQRCGLYKRKLIIKKWRSAC